MRLAKVTLAGFKSFADPTEFRFDAPVTGVVGPNGCGKSNVVDAVRWVLGERSAKHLRGDAMLDVIFAGSASRKPVGAASVTLTFDNPIVRPDAETVELQRSLPVDAEQVDVTRRLYRDGRSEYLINGAKCRLRDIKELFLDTGIGVNAYCIIEQGRVDAMLTANPVERRAILEEAAGVARFKARKIESLRKLERTEINLVRVREQLASTERRLRTVRRQAEKARRFRDLDSRYRQLRRDLSLDFYHELRRRLDGLTSQITTLEQRRQALTAELREREDAKQTAEISRHELQDEMRQVQQRQLELVAARRHAEQRQEMTRRNLHEARQHVEDERSRAEGFTGQINEMTGRLDNASAGIVDVQAQLEEAQQRVNDLGESRAEHGQALMDAQQRCDKAREALSRGQDQRASVGSQLESIAARRQELDGQVQRLDQRLAAIAGQIDQCREAEDSAGRLREEAQARVESFESRLAERDRAVSALGQREAALTQRTGEVRHRRAAMESRLHLLEEMHQAREGLGEAVKHVLDDPDRFPGIRGLLADAIDTDREHAPLVEAALGPNLEFLLFDELDDLRRIREAMEQSRGRVGFIAGAWIHEPAPDDCQDGPRPDGPAATPLLSLMRVEPYAASAARRLLGRTMVVADLSTAILMLQGPLAGYRFVTREGEVVEPDGRIISGHPASPSTDGWLTRRIEMAECRRRLVSIDEHLARLEDELSRLLSDSAQTRQQRDEAEQTLQAARHEVIDAQYQLQRTGNDLQRLQREGSSLESERSGLAGRLESLHVEQEQLRARLHEIGEALRALADAAEGADETRQSAQAELEAVQEQLTAARIDLGQVGEKVEATQRERRHLELALDEARRQHEVCRHQLHRRLSQIEQYEAVIEEATEEMAGVDTHAGQAHADMQQMERRLDEAAAGLVEAAERLEETRGECTRLDRDYHAVEIARREVEIKREALEERSLEELELDLSAAYVPYRSLRDEESFEPVQRDTAEAEVDRLRQEIRELGPVNLEAIEEETNLAERNEDLIHQVEDIDTAHARLKALIEDLDIRSENRFKETFEAIRQHFAGPEGMFRKLFGGGSADVMILPGENGRIDWLSGGIEIRAKPPGKEPRVISQLSGGEKAMTAVALLLAIFKSKPSPFCILDEVDAALDDANVDRFSRILSQFLGNSHFVVITHNKRTMMTCDRLYGVTMQERGVSKQVAVRVEDVREDGTLDRASLARAEAAETAEPVETNGEVEQAPEPPLIEVIRAGDLQKA